MADKKLYASTRKKKLKGGERNRFWEEIFIAPKKKSPTKLHVTGNC